MWSNIPFWTEDFYTIEWKIRKILMNLIVKYLTLQISENIEKDAKIALQQNEEVEEGGGKKKKKKMAEKPE